MKKFLLISFLLGFTLNVMSQSVGIGSAEIDPDPSAALHIEARGKGLLIPRMTMAERDNIANPATGLLIYQVDEDEGFYYFDGNRRVWENIEEEVLIASLEPSDGKEGDIYYNTTDKNLYIYGEGEWQPVRTGNQTLSDVLVSGSDADGLIIQNLPLPIADGDAANKAYVDNASGSIPTASENPNTGLEQEGDLYYNTEFNEIFVYTDGAWVSTDRWEAYYSYGHEMLFVSKGTRVDSIDFGGVTKRLGGDSPAIYDRIRARWEYYSKLLDGGYPDTLIRTFLHRETRLPPTEFDYTVPFVTSPLSYTKRFFDHPLNEFPLPSNLPTTRSSSATTRSSSATTRSSSATTRSSYRTPTIFPNTALTPIERGEGTFSALQFDDNTGRFGALIGGELFEVFPDKDEQSLFIEGDSLRIDRGSGVLLSSLGSDDQKLEYNSLTKILTLEDGGDSIDLGGLDTDDQQLGLTGSFLTLENGGGVDLGGLNTDDQELTLTGTILALKRGGRVDLENLLNNGSIPISDTAPDMPEDGETYINSSDSTLYAHINGDWKAINTDDQQLEYDSSTKILTLEDGGDSIDLSGLYQTLAEVLAQDSSAEGRRITNLAAPQDSADAATKYYVDNKMANATELDLDSGNILVGGTDDKASAVAMSGDVVMDSEGVTVIQDTAVSTENIADGAVTIEKIGAEPHNANSVLTTNANGDPIWTLLDSVDNQQLSLSGKVLSLERGGDVNLEDLLNNGSIPISDTVPGMPEDGDTYINSSDSTLYAYINGDWKAINTDDQQLEYDSSTKILTLEDGGDSIDLSGLYQTLAEVLSQDSSAGGSRITNLAGPIDSSDAATKYYVDDKVAVATELLVKEDSLFIGGENALPLSSLGSDDQKLEYNSLTKILTLEDGGDSIDLSGLDTDDQTLAEVLAQDSSAEGRKISNLANPTDSADAATKYYVDDKVAVATELLVKEDSLFIGGENALPLSSLGSDDQQLEYDSLTKILTLEDGGDSIDLSGLDTDDQTLAEVLAQDSSAGGSRITNLAGPIDSADAATKYYVDNKMANATELDLDSGNILVGGTDDKASAVAMSGDVVMDSEGVTIIQDTAVSTENIVDGAVTIEKIGAEPDNANSVLTTNANGDPIWTLLDSVDNQQLSLSGKILSLERGGDVNLEDLLKNGSIPISDTVPGMPEDGDTYINSSDSTLYAYINGVWKAINTDDQKLEYDSSTKILTLEDGGDSIDLSGLYQTLAEVLSQDSSAGGSKISNLANPTDSADAATKYYVDDKVAVATELLVKEDSLFIGGENALPLSSLGSDDQKLEYNSLTKILTLEDGGDSIDLSGLDTDDQTLAEILSQDSSAGGSRISNLGEPTVDSDAATKNYVDNKMADATELDLDSGNILVGGANNKASAVAMSGDVVMDSEGVTIIQDTAVSTENIVDGAVTIEKIGAEPDNANSVLTTNASGEPIWTLLDSVDNQQLSLSGKVLSLERGGDVNLEDLLKNGSIPISDTVPGMPEDGDTYINSSDSTLYAYINGDWKAINTDDQKLEYDSSTKILTLEDGGDSIDLSGLYQTLAEVLSQDSSAGGSKISNLANPTDSADAATKYYVDDKVAVATELLVKEDSLFIGGENALPLSSLGSDDQKLEYNSLTKILTLEDGGDSIDLSGLDTDDQTLAEILSQDSSAGGSRISNLGEPTVDSDAATKNYVDNKMADATELDLDSGNILVGGANNKASAVAMSGDVVMDSEGVTIIQDTAVSTENIVDGAVTIEKIGAEPDNANSVLTTNASGEPIWTLLDSVDNQQLSLSGKILSLERGGDVNLEDLLKNGSIPISDTVPGMPEDGDTYINSSDSTLYAYINGNWKAINTDDQKLEYDSSTKILTLEDGGDSIDLSGLYQTLAEILSQDSSAGGSRISNLGEPTVDSDAATKNYVDNKMADATELDLDSGNILVGGTNNKASAVAMSGDVVMDSEGVTIIQDTAVSTENIVDGAVTIEKIGAEPDNANSVLTTNASGEPIWTLLDSVDNQQLSLSGKILSLERGGDVNLEDLLKNGSIPISDTVPGMPEDGDTYINSSDSTLYAYINGDWKAINTDDQKLEYDSSTKILTLEDGGDSIDLSGLYQTLAEVLSQDSSAGGSKISNLANPTDSADAATKYYVDDKVAVATELLVKEDSLFIGGENALPLSSLGSDDQKLEYNSLTKILTLEDGGDSIDLSGLDTDDQTLAEILSQDSSAGGSRISNLGEPTVDSDAATKNYVDNKMADATELDLDSGNILVGGANNKASAVAMSGDVVMDSEGVTIIQDTAVSTENIVDGAVTIEKIGAEPDNANSVLTTNASGEPIWTLLDSVDNQQLSLSGKILSLERGGDVNLEDLLKNGSIPISDTVPGMPEDGDTYINSSDSTLYAYINGDWKAINTDDQKLEYDSSTKILTLEDGGDSIDLSGLYQTLAEVLSQDSSAGGSRISNLANPTDSADAATKNYVDDQVAAAGDNLGNHTATQNILLQDNWISNDTSSIEKGIKLKDSGSLQLKTTSTDVATFERAGNMKFRLKSTGDSRPRIDRNLGHYMNVDGDDKWSMMISRPVYKDKFNFLIKNYDAAGSDLMNAFYIGGDSSKVGIHTTNPQATLDIKGNIRIEDGTQGAGKVLTSDAEGKGVWKKVGINNIEANGNATNSVLATNANGDLEWTSLDSVGNQTLEEVLAQGSSAGGSRISDLAAPQDSSDAATKNYVDNKMADATELDLDSGNILVGGANNKASAVAMSGDVVMDSEGVTIIQDTAVSTENIVDGAVTIEKIGAEPDNANSVLTTNASGEPIWTLLDSVDNQQLSLSGKVLSLERGGDVNLEDLLKNGSIPISDTVPGMPEDGDTYINSSDSTLYAYINGDWKAINTDDQKLEYDSSTKILTLEDGGDSIDLSGLYQTLAEVLSQDSSAGGSKISNLANPTDSADAATKYYVDDKVAAATELLVKEDSLFIGGENALPLSSLGSDDQKLEYNSLTKILTLEDGGDSIDLSGLDTDDQTLAEILSQDSSAGGSRISNLGEPTVDSDAATKNYVDNKMADATELDLDSGNILVGGANNKASAVAMSGDVVMDSEGVTIIQDTAVSTENIVDGAVTIEKIGAEPDNANSVLTTNASGEPIWTLLDSVDNQQLSLSGKILSLERGGDVNLEDLLKNGSIPISDTVPGMPEDGDTYINSSDSTLYAYINGDWKAINTDDQQLEYDSSTKILTLEDGGDSIDLSGLYQTLAEVLSQDSSAGGSKISNLANPTDSADAATKYYVDDKVAAATELLVKEDSLFIGGENALPLSSLGSDDQKLEYNSLTKILTLEDGGDSIDLSGLDTDDQTLAEILSQDSSAGGSRISNLGEPTVDSDAATKNYVDNKMADATELDLDSGNILVGGANNKASAVAMSGDVVMDSEGVTIIQDTAVSTENIVDGAVTIEKIGAEPDNANSVLTTNASGEPIWTLLDSVDNQQLSLSGKILSLERGGDVNLEDLLKNGSIPISDTVPGMPEDGDTYINSSDSTLYAYINGDWKAINTDDQKLEYDSSTKILTLEDGGDSIDLSGLYQTLAEVLSQDSSAGGSKISNLANPTDSADAATKYYVDDKVAVATELLVKEDSLFIGGENALPLSSLGSDDQKLEYNSLTKILTLEDGGDSIDLSGLDTDDQTLAEILSQDSSAGGSRISNLGEPTVDSDAATKNYVDNKMADATELDLDSGNILVGGANDKASAVAMSGDVVMDSEGVTIIQDTAVSTENIVDGAVTIEKIGAEPDNANSVLTTNASGEPIWTLLDSVDNQQLSLSGKILSLERGGDVNLEDLLKNGSIPISDTVPGMPEDGDTYINSSDSTLYAYINGDWKAINTDDQKLEYDSSTKILTLEDGGDSIDLSGLYQTLAEVLSQDSSAGGSRITNLAAPQDSSDAATKNYVDDQVAAAGDNLGNHTATQNILLQDNWISNDTSSIEKGIKLKDSGSLQLKTTSTDVATFERAGNMKFRLKSTGDSRPRIDRNLGHYMNVDGDDKWSMMISRPVYKDKFNFLIKNYDAAGSDLMNAFYIGGDSSKVGIHTTNPQATLDIKGNIRIEDGTQGAGKVLTSDAEGKGVWKKVGINNIEANGNATNSVLATNANGDLEWTSLDSVGNQTLEEVLAQGSSAGGSRISDLAAPQDSSDAATKYYVDNKMADATELDLDSGNILVGGANNKASAVAMSGDVVMDSEGVTIIQDTAVSTENIVDGAVTIEKIGAEPDNANSVLTTNASGEPIWTLLDSVDNQQLSLSGKILSLERGGDVNLEDLLKNGSIPISDTVPGMPEDGDTYINSSDSTLYAYINGDWKAINTDDQKLEYDSSTKILTLEDGGDSIDLSGLYQTLAEVLSQDSSAGGSKISNLANPTDSADAATKYYVDDKVAVATELLVKEDSLFIGGENALPLSSLGSDDQKLEYNSLTKILTLEDGGDSIDLSGLDTDDQTLAEILSQDSSAGGSRISNLGEPTVDSDAATKNYVDNKMADATELDLDSGNILVGGANNKASAVAMSGDVVMDSEGVTIIQDTAVSTENIVDGAVTIEKIGAEPDNANSVLTTNASGEPIWTLLDSVDNQQLSLSGKILSLERGGDVNLEDLLKNGSIPISDTVPGMPEDGDTYINSSDSTLYAYINGDWKAINTDDQQLEYDSSTKILTLEDGGDSIDLSGLYQTLAEVLSQDSSAGGSKISNLANPTDSADAATKYYVDDKVAGATELLVKEDSLFIGGENALPLSSLGSDDQKLEYNSLTKILTLEDGGDSIDLSGLDTDDQTLAEILSQDSSAGGSRISNLGEPTVDSDAATKNYVDNKMADATELDLDSGNILVGGANNKASAVAMSGDVVMDSEGVTIIQDTAVSTENIVDGAVTIEKIGAEPDNANSVLTTNASGEPIWTLLDSVDNQQLSLSGKILSLERGGDVNLEDLLKNGSIPISDTVPGMPEDGDTYINSSDSTLYAYINGDWKAINTDDQKLEYDSSTKILTLEDGGDSIDLSGLYQTLAEVLSQDSSAGGSKISNLANPTDSADAATKNYVDDQVAAAGDNLGNHTATQNILLQGNWISNNTSSIEKGIKLKDSGSLQLKTTSTDVATFERAGDMKFRLKSTGDSRPRIDRNLGHYMNVDGDDKWSMMISRPVYKDKFNFLIKNYDAAGSDLMNAFYIGGDSSKVGIHTTNPQATLDIKGNIRIEDGTQGAGKVLTSDAEGKGVWKKVGINNIEANGNATNSVLATNANGDLEWTSLDSVGNQTLEEVLAQGSSAGGSRISDLAAPQDSSDAATKNYVDNKMADATELDLDSGNILVGGANNKASAVAMSGDVVMDSEGVTIIQDTAVSTENIVDGAVTIEKIGAEPDNANSVLTTNASGEPIWTLLDSVDNQQLSLSGKILSLERGGDVNLEDLLKNGSIPISDTVPGMPEDGDTYINSSDSTLYAYINGDWKAINTDDQKLEYDSSTKILTLEDGGDSIDLSGLYQTLAEVLSQDSSAGGSKISNLANPTDSADAATKYYVDDKVAAATELLVKEDSLFIGGENALPLSSLGSDDQKLEYNSLTKILTLEDGGDSIDLSGLDTDDQTLAEILSQDSSAGGSRISNLGEPTVDSDAATKNYVDNKMADATELDLDSGNILVGGANNKASAVAMSGDVVMDSEGVTIIQDTAVSTENIVDGAVTIEKIGAEPDNANSVLTTNASGEPIWTLLDSVDNQQLSLSGKILSLERGGDVNLEDLLKNGSIPISDTVPGMPEDGDTYINSSDSTLYAYINGDWKAINTDDQKLEYDSSTKILTLEDGGDSIDLSGLYQTLAEVLSQDSSAGGSRISNLANPTDSADAATKNYVDDKVAVATELLVKEDSLFIGGENALPLSSLGTDDQQLYYDSLTKILTLEDGGDSIDLSGLDTDDQTLAEVLSQDSSAGGSRITNLAAPQDSSDAATKNYVDDQVAAAGDNLGNHTATQNILLQDNWISNNTSSIEKGIKLKDSGSLQLKTTSTDVATFERAGDMKFRLKSTGDSRPRIDRNLGHYMNVDGDDKWSMMISRPVYKDKFNFLIKNYDAAGSDLMNAFYIGGDSSKVGIHTTNPQATLDIKGNIKIEDGTQGAGKVLTSDAEGKGVWKKVGINNIEANGNATNSVLATNANGDLEWTSLDSVGNQTLEEVLAQGSSAGGSRISDLAAPQDSSDAATKYYVDDKVADATELDLDSGNILVGGANNKASAVAMSGDVVMDSEGVTIIQDTAVSTENIVDGAVTIEKIGAEPDNANSVLTTNASGEPIWTLLDSVDNQQLSLSDDTLRLERGGGVALTRLRGSVGDLDLDSGNILVGGANNKASAVEMSGDVAIDSAGVTSIQDTAVSTGNIADEAVTAAKLDRILRRSILRPMTVVPSNIANFTPTIDYYIYIIKANQDLLITLPDPANYKDVEFLFKRWDKGTENGISVRFDEANIVDGVEKTIDVYLQQMWFKSDGQKWLFFN